MRDQSVHKPTFVTERTNMTESNIQVLKEALAHQGTTATQAPTHDAIAKRAYEIYAQHGHQKGHCNQHWQQAEKDLKHQAQTNPGSATKKSQ